MTDKQTDVVLFSGGYDSTAILHKVLQDSSKENPTLIISFDYHENLDKKQAEAEKQARKRILKKLEKDYYFDHKKIIIKSELDTTPAGYAQASWWFIHSLPYLPDNSTVYLSYISGDDMVAAMNEFTILEKVANRFMYKTVIYDNRFSMLDKHEVITYLSKHNLFDLCWTCDSPEKPNKYYRQCGKCWKCIEIELAEKKAELYKKYNIKYKEIL